MSYSSHAPYAPPDSWSAGAPTAAGSSSTRRALPSSPLPPSSSSSAAAAYSRWSPSSATVLLNDEPAPPTAGRKRSHTTLCEFESHDDGGGGRPPAGAREADDDGHSASSYYGSEFDRFREPVADAGGGGDVGAFDRPDADANDELDEERAYRRIEERLKRRRGDRAAHANRHDVADGSETLRSSFGSGEYRLALDGSPTGARDVEPMQVEPALPLPSSALFRPPSSLPPLSSPAAAAALDPSASRPWAFGSASIGRAAPHSPIASPAAPPFTAPVHAMSSSYSRAAHSQQRSLTPAAALPLSMRRRPPLVRNATAVPAPLSPEISRPAAPAEGGRSYFHPTPPPTMPNSTAAARSRFSSPTTGTTQPTPAVDPSPTTTTFVSRANASLFAPRRPGAMDASGRLRGPSRSANESWLGIRTDSPPPVLSSVEAGATFDLSGGSGSGGRVSPPLSPSDVASSSTGRSSARAWAPIGTGSSARSLFSSPPQPTRILSRPWSGVGPPSDDLQLPPAPASSTSTATAASQSTGLRPFRLRPRAVAPLLPVTTSPSASARRTSLLAQLGSVNEEEESLVSDLGSTGVVRSRFDSAADGFSSARRRRAHPVADTSAPAEEGDAAGPGPSSSPPPFSSFRPLLLGEGLRSREAMTPPPAPTLSFLRPLQLPLSANGSISPATVAPSPAPHRSRPAPPILTATFGADDDDEDDFGSSSPELEDSLPLADLSRLNPQTRLPVMLSSGLLSGRGEASTASSTALPSFSSALASDWSSTPASPPVVDPGRPDRRTPMLRPLRTTDHGFSARFAAGPAASSAPSSSTESMPPSSFAPFSDSLASGAAGPSLSSERASTSTASTRRGEPSGAGSRLAEYLSRHSERRRRLLPGLFEPDEPAGERQGDEWSGSLMDWFSTRPVRLCSRPRAESSACGLTTSSLLFARAELDRGPSRDPADGGAAGCPSPTPARAASLAIDHCATRAGRGRHRRSGAVLQPLAHARGARHALGRCVGRPRTTAAGAADRRLHLGRAAVPIAVQLHPAPLECRPGATAAAAARLD